MQSLKLMWIISLQSIYIYSIKKEQVMFDTNELNKAKALLQTLRLPSAHMSG